MTVSKVTRNKGPRLGTVLFIPKCLLGCLCFYHRAKPDGLDGSFIPEEGLQGLKNKPSNIHRLVCVTSDSGVLTCYDM